MGQWQVRVNHKGFLWMKNESEAGVVRKPSVAQVTFCGPGLGACLLPPGQSSCCVDPQGSIIVCCGAVLSTAGFYQHPKPPLTRCQEHQPPVVAREESLGIIKSPLGAKSSQAENAALGVRL